MFFIGLDIGTTSICGVLYDTLHDKVVRELHGENHFLREQASDRIRRRLLLLPGEYWRIFLRTYVCRAKRVVREAGNKA